MKYELKTALALLCIYALMLCAGAYMVNQARMKPNYNLTMVEIPRSLLIDSGKIAELMNMHAAGGQAGYQSGYSDALDDVRRSLGISRSPYRSRPAMSTSVAVTIPYVQTITFRRASQGYYAVNGSMYRLIINNGTRLYELPIINGTVQLWER